MYKVLANKTPVSLVLPTKEITTTDVLFLAFTDMGCSYLIRHFPISL
jgi:hypothetical protein